MKIYKITKTHKVAVEDHEDERDAIRKLAKFDTDVAFSQVQKLRRNPEVEVVDVDVEFYGTKEDSK